MAAPIKYTLGEAELQALSARLLTRPPPTTKDALVIYCVEGTDELANLGRHVERIVFEEAFGLDDGRMRRLYGPYECASVFFVALDQQRVRPVGALRAIRPSPAGLLTLHEVERHLGITATQFRQHHGLAAPDANAVADAEVIDWGTAAVLPSQRSVDGHLVAMALYRGAHVHSCREGARHYICLVDEALHRTFDRMGFPFVPLAESSPFAHEGSAQTTALYGHAPNYTAAVQRWSEQAPALLRPMARVVAARFNHGIGIDHRLMFDFKVWPGGSSPVQKGGKAKRATEKL